MNKNFDTALAQAFEKEFSWLDDFENLYANYEFSSQFESKMRSIIPKSEFSYVSVGRRRIRKTMLVALVALLAIVITGCAFGVYYLVTWNEDQNDKQGTLDINFEINGEQPASSKLPTIPEGYTIVRETSDEFSHIIRYSNDNGLLIGFTKYIGLENRSVSIDNEEADFKEATINGYRGYTYFKDGIHALYWADTENFYLLQGTCELDILLTMAESMVD